MKNQRKAGAFLSYISLAITTLIQLLFTPFLLNKLGQSEYGLYSLVSSVIGYLTILDLGFGNAIVVYTAKYRAKNDTASEQKLHGMFKVIFWLLGIIVSLFGILLYLNTEKLFGATMTTEELSKAKIMMAILTANLAITFAFNIYSSIITAYERFVYQKLIAITGTILEPLIMVPFLLLGFDSVAMVLIISAVNLCVVISNYLYCHKVLHVAPKYQGIDKPLLISIVTFSFWIFLNIIVDKVNWSLDQFILGAVASTAAVSIYSIASQINAAFLALSTAIAGVLLPKISKMIAKKATAEQLTEEMIKIGRIQFFVVFLALSGFILVGKDFITLWAGPEYVESYYVTICLIAPAIFSLIQNTGLSILQALNKHKFRAIVITIGAALNILLSIFLADKFGPIGAALGTAITLLLCNTITMNIYYQKAIHINILKFWRNILLIAFKLSPAIILTVVAIQLTSFSGISALLIYGGIYISLYALLAYFIASNSYERETLKQIFRKNIEYAQRKIHTRLDKKQ